MNDLEEMLDNTLLKNNDIEAGIYKAKSEIYSKLSYTVMHLRKYKEEIDELRDILIEFAEKINSPPPNDESN